MKYRILKNEAHYTIQRKRWGMWWYYCRYEDPAFFATNMSDCDKYDSLEDVKERLLEIINKEKQEAINNKKDTSEYHVVNTAIDTPLYNAINEANSDV